jgi:hypothetical protein
VQTEQRTPLPIIPPLLTDVLSGPLPSDGPDIVDAGACVACRGNMFTGCCQAMDVSSEFAILALNRRILCFSVDLSINFPF